MLHNKFYPLFVTIIALCSCSIQQAALRYADDISYYQVDDYLDLNDSQKTLVKKTLSKHWLQIRCYELKGLIKDLDKLQSFVMQTNIEANNLWFEERGRYWRQKFLVPLLGTASEVLSQLKKDQFEELDEELLDSNEKWIELVKMDADDYKEALEERITDNFERIYDDLQEAQKKDVFASLWMTQSETSDYLKQRQSAQRQFVDFLKQNPTEKQTLNMIQKWLQSPESLRSKEMQKKYLHFRENRTQKWLQIHNTIADDKQRLFFQKKIIELKKDIQAITLNPSEKNSKCLALKDH